MPSPLRDNDHYVLKKLCNELLPWMIGGRMARKQWFVHVAGVYGYGAEIFTALAGVGIGAPVVAIFQGKSDGKDATTVLREMLPGIWFWVGIVALVVWVVLRVVVNKNQAVERSLFARDCAKSMEKLHANLYQVLATPDPIAKINDIQASVMKRMEEAIDKGVWPFSPPAPPDADIGLELTSQINNIRMNFMDGWQPPPPAPQPGVPQPAVPQQPAASPPVAP